MMMSAVGCSDSDKGTETGAGGESGGGKGGTPSAAGSTNNGGDSTDKGGQGGAGPTPGGADAGGADAGGADAGGADAGGADAGGAGGADAGGVSVAKFCNDLVTLADEDTTYILEIGEGADKVTFTAKTGVCVPADGVACKSIPLGPEVPVALFDAEAPTEVVSSGTIDSADGDKWIFKTIVNAQDEADMDGNAVSDEFTCEEITYDDVYPPT
jgi:hypothetical protein